MTTDVDILEVLERDHQRIRDLAERLDSVTDDDEIRDLYRQIVDGLLAHEAIEQDVLYPAFHKVRESGVRKSGVRESGAPGSEAPLDARLGEHEELNSLLAEMQGLDAHDNAFVKRGSALLLEMERHFELEEESVFAPMREHLTKEALIELGRRALAPGTDD